MKCTKPPGVFIAFTIVEMTKHLSSDANIILLYKGKGTSTIMYRVNSQLSPLGEIERALYIIMVQITKDG